MFLPLIENRLPLKKHFGFFKMFITFSDLPGMFTPAHAKLCLYPSEFRHKASQLPRNPYFNTIFYSWSIILPQSTKVITDDLINPLV